MPGTKRRTRKKPGKPRRPTAKTAAVSVIAAQRQEQAVTLRLAGHTFREIGKAIGITHQRAYQLVEEALQDTEERSFALAEKVRAQDLARLDRMLKAVWPQVVGEGFGVTEIVEDGAPAPVTTASEKGVKIEGKGSEDGETGTPPKPPRVKMTKRALPNLAAIDRVLRIMERRAKLTGADAPQQIEGRLGIYPAEKPGPSLADVLRALSPKAREEVLEVYRDQLRAEHADQLPARLDSGPRRSGG